MNFPSTNTDGRNPAAGGIVSNVESSHGVLLDGGSTGGIVTAIGDDANITLRIRGKGTGAVVLGNSSSPVLFGTSTRTTFGAFSQDSTWSRAGITGGHGEEITFASTTVNINPGDLLSIGMTIATSNESSRVGIAHWRLSTAATSRLTVTLNTFGSTATSTLSGTFHLAWFDLT
jgi:hypothetical protein